MLFCFLGGGFCYHENPSKEDKLVMHAYYCYCSIKIINKTKTAISHFTIDG